MAFEGGRGCSAGGRERQGRGGKSRERGQGHRRRTRLALGCLRSSSGRGLRPSATHSQPAAAPRWQAAPGPQAGVQVSAGVGRTEGHHFKWDRAASPGGLHRRAGLKAVSTGAVPAGARPPVAHLARRPGCTQARSPPCTAAPLDSPCSRRTGRRGTGRRPCKTGWPAGRARQRSTAGRSASSRRGGRCRCGPASSASPLRCRGGGAGRGG